MASPRRRGATGVQIGESRARALILQGAARVFADKGTRLATVADILAEAKVSRRTFYRLYGSKDEVMLVLYRMGTDRLLGECRAAAATELEPIVVAERFIDAHLRNAGGLSRLVFVLGGEAARQESILHPARMEVHQTLVEMLAVRLPDVDPLLSRGLLLALEGVTRRMLEDCDEGRQVTPEALARVRAVMMRIATASLAGAGAAVAPLPRLPR
jgi:AcrR family transcriptional regulator